MTAVSGDVTAAAVSAGTRTLAVLLLNFSNDRSTPFTTATVRSVVFDSPASVNAYYRDASGGQVGFSGAVFGWYPIANDNAGCQFSAWADAARAAATAAGVDLSAYLHTMYVFPRTSSCAWSGISYLPGPISWINGDMTLRATGHELGHNLGVHHASSLNCTDASGARVAWSTTCTTSEYGDPFTIMGYGASRLLSNWHREQLGWLSDSRVTTTGDYALAPVESTGTPRVLSIARGDGTYYQLEFRQPSACSTTSPRPTRR